MKLARSLAHGIACLVLLLVILAVGIIIFDERQSRILGGNDTTVEEMTQNIKYGGERGEK
jgi:ABC-type cobalt transport system substrate-binding protein